MNATIQTPTVKTESACTPILVAKLIGGDIHQPPALETINMTMLAIHDCVADGILDSAASLAESLVHQVRMLRLKKMADAAGVVSKG